MEGDNAANKCKKIEYTSPAVEIWKQSGHMKKKIAFEASFVSDHTPGLTESLAKTWTLVVPPPPEPQLNSSLGPARLLAQSPNGRLTHKFTQSVSLQNIELGVLPVTERALLRKSSFPRWHLAQQCDVVCLWHHKRRPAARPPTCSRKCKGRKTHFQSSIFTFKYHHTSRVRRRFESIDPASKHSDSTPWRKCNPENNLPLWCSQIILFSIHQIFSLKTWLHIIRVLLVFNTFYGLLVTHWLCRSWFILQICLISFRIITFFFFRTGSSIHSSIFDITCSLSCTGWAEAYFRLTVGKRQVHSAPVPREIPRRPRGEQANST